MHITIKTPSYTCHCCEVENSLKFLDAFKQLIDKLATEIFAGKDKKISKEHYKQTADYLTNAAVDGWSKGRKTGVAYNVADYQYLTMLEANIHRFSAAKSVALVKEMNKALKANQGSFSAFKNEVDKLGIQYDGNYLNTEYNFAIATGQNGGKWLRIKDEKDLFPYVKYQTIGDANVREAHGKLNGKKFKVGSKELNLIAPPNGWNCRCELLQVTEDDEAETFGYEETVNALQGTPGARKGESEFDYMKRERFNVNRGELQTVFLENQMYIRSFKERGFGVADWDVTPYDQIKQENLPMYDGQNRDNASATAWFMSRNVQAPIKDFRSFPVNFPIRTFKSAVSQSARYVDAIEPVLQLPDEVWLVTDGKNYLYRYIRFYKKEPVMVEVQVGKDEAQNIVWWGKIGEMHVDKNWRNGVLLYEK